MKTFFALVLLTFLALPLTLSASGPELFSISFKHGQPSVDNDLTTSVDSAEWLRRVVEHDSQIMLRIDEVRYQVVGRADPSECADAQCSALALKRAQLFQDALVSAGVPLSLFCPPAALGPPWPATYRPTPEQLLLARQAGVEPVFDGCEQK
ncbi:hypothetical protein [Xanthomonas sacchari]|uniref:hypothetical protein n=1 Tax=Xanthomonas sacchari TaxID=56458 RepID=UPI0022582259|nr:hypothetical protein [Xanthomonas sacchari]